MFSVACRGVQACGLVNAAVSQIGLKGLEVPKTRVCS